MHKFLITSKNYTGQVEIVYNNSVLHSISFADTTMLPVQRKSFKEAVPVGLHGLDEFVKHYNIVCVESDYEVSFDDFWNKYNRKVNKARCLPVWAKMNRAEQLAAVLFITKYNRFCERDGRARLDPENYLKRKTWENEY